MKPVVKFRSHVYIYHNKGPKSDFPPSAGGPGSSRVNK